MSRRRSGAVALLLSLGTLGGIGGPGAVASSDVPAACNPARVQYTPFPGGDSRLRSPWIRAKPLRAGLVGQIWYWPEEWTRRRVRTARIFAGGVAPAGYSTKILWAFVSPSAANGAGPRLVVRGRRLDGLGSFTHRFAAISYSGQKGPSFASIVDVPEPGCWRLELSSARLRGSVTLLAVSGARARSATSAVSSAAPPTAGTAPTRLTLDGMPLRPELALTTSRRARGLMFRRRAPADGMLFVFRTPTSGGFWMRNTLVPLTIVFFNANGERVRRMSMIPCGGVPCRIYDPRRVYRFALELPASDRRPARRLGPRAELRRLIRLAE